MKYLYQIILLFFVCSLLHSQPVSGTATYSIKLAEDVLRFPAILKFNGNSSKFQYKNHNGNRWERDEGDESFQVIYTDSIGELVIKQENKKYLTIRSFCQKKPYVYDDEAKIKWDKTEEIRLIEGLLCKKATTHFRGRIYSAWYCPEINVNVGPWKFNGLPGLILEVYDDSNSVQITIESVKIQKDVELTVSNLTGRQISQSEFIKYLDLEWDKKTEKNKADILILQAQFPDLEINDGGLSTKKRLDVATEIEYE